MSKYVLFLSALFALSNFTGANEITSLIEVEVPAKSEMVYLGKIENREVKSIKYKIKDSIIQLPQGKYIYKIQVPGSYNTFEGKFELLPGDKKSYIYKHASPDRSVAYVFPSKYEKGSKEYEAQFNDIRCSSIFSYTVSQQFSQTLTTCEKLAAEGSVTAQYVVGKAYSDERSELLNTAKAKKYFEMAFKGGDENAGNQLAYLYQRDGDYKNYLPIIRKLADKNNPRALVSMAIQYLTGEQLPKNPDKAKELLMKAANQGFDFAYRLLSELPTTQNQENPDLIESLAWGVLYLRSSNYSDYTYENFYNSIISELTKTQLGEAKIRTSTLLEKFKQFNQGRICVPAKKYLSSSLSGKKLQYKLNQLNELIDINNDEVQVGIVQIPSNKVQSEISFYIDGEFYLSKTFDMDNEYLIDKCLVYNEAIDSYDLEDIGTQKNCNCFND